MTITAKADKMNMMQLQLNELKDVWQKRGLTSTQLADELGISKAHLYRLIKGGCGMSQEVYTRVQELSDDSCVDEVQAMDDVDEVEYGQENPFEQLRKSILERGQEPEEPFSCTPETVTITVDNVELRGPKGSVMRLIEKVLS